MREQVAASWIGWHAAAFALHALLGACLFYLIEDRFTWVTGAGIHVADAMLLGLPVGAAQALSGWGRRFPIPSYAWIPATVVSAGLGSWAGFKTLGTYVRAFSSSGSGAVDEVLRYGLVVAMLSATAVVLAGGQALALLWKTSARTATLWWAWAGGAWFASQLSGFALGWLGLVPGEGLSMRLGAWDALFACLLSAAQGALFALITLPLFRRLAPLDA